MRAANPRDGLRAQRAVEALRLRAEGMLFSEIAVALGISRSYASDLVRDPSGQATRRRKSSYGGTCEVCGKATDGSNGRAAAPKLCAACNATKQHEERRWTPDACLEGIRVYVERYGEQPMASDLLRFPEPDVPSVGTLQKEFGTWSAAMQAAGFESRVGVKPRHRKREDGMGTYKVLSENGKPGVWQEVGEAEAASQSDALRAFLKEQPEGTTGRYVIVPENSWHPRRVKFIMKPSLITIPD